VSPRLSLNTSAVIFNTSSKTNIFENKLIYCRHFRTYSQCAMFDWSDTVFRRRNVTRRRISNTVLQPRYWGREADSRHCDEWKYVIIGRIFESEIILIPPSLKIFESSSNGSYRNTDEVWWRYGISRRFDWSDTVFRRRNVTRRRISNTVLQPRYWGREADSPEACLLASDFTEELPFFNLGIWNSILQL
jgi:hypothetical protein